MGDRVDVETTILGRLARVRHVVLDMDGTIYLGGRLLPCTLPFLVELRRRGIGCTFLTNNNSLGRREYVRKLNAMGIEVGPAGISTSADATAHYLSRHLHSVRRLWILGTAGLREDLTEAGFTPCDTDPDAVVVGYDTGLNYDRLCQTAWWISRGLPFIATHPDRVCPTDHPTVLPDCGAICALLERATGRAPDVVCGKPEPPMLTAVLDRHGVAPHEAMMVGDRLYTDVEMARRVGALAVLVLTGEATREQAEGGRAELVADDLTELGSWIERAMG